MSKRFVPSIVERYVFIRLCGADDIRRADDDELRDDHNTKFTDPLLSMSPPFKGIYSLCGDALRESASYSEEIASIYFDCPVCGHGPHCHPEDRWYLDHCESERSRADKLVKQFNDDIGRLRRFVDIDLMGEAYDLLGNALRDEEQWFHFIEAAQNARQNYSEYRRIQRKAQRLVSDFSNTADRLITLLNELRRTCVQLPDELRDRNAQPEMFLTASESNEVSNLKRLRFIEGIIRGASTCNEVATDLKSILLRAAEVTKHFQPSFASPDIDAAIATRQDSRKSAYLRAFGALLAKAGIDVDARVKKAMAITANAIMNDDQLSISEDDVRKALTRLPKVGPHEKMVPSISRRKTRAYRSP